MDERDYVSTADKTFRRVMQALDAVDAEDVDVDSTGDVITMTFKGGKRCVLNTQRPARQIWLAGGQRAWHFSYDGAQERWLDDKGGEELFATLARLVKETVNVDVSF